MLSRCLSVVPGRVCILQCGQPGRLWIFHRALLMSVKQPQLSRPALKPPSLWKTEQARDSEIPSRLSAFRDNFSGKTGKNIDKQGITPDKVVKISDADIKAGKDPQLSAATEYLKK